MSSKIEINRLTGEELQYELHIRGFEDGGTVAEMRSALRGLLKLEKEGNSLEYPEYSISFEEDQEAVQARMTELTALIETLNLDHISKTQKKFSAKFQHTLDRCKRAKTTTLEETKVKNTLFFKLSQLTSKLDDEIARLRRSSVASQVPLNLNSTRVEDESAEGEDEAIFSARESDEEGIAEERVLNNTIVASPSFTRPVPVFKWGLKFGGKPMESISSFLERVEELRVARSVTVGELFSSATDLFSDEALIWYRANRSVFSTWKDLCTGLRSEFQPPDYDENLYEEIKHRTQGKSETVGIYLAKMETLFRRLNTTVSELAKVTIIKRNMLPYYQSQLALVDVNTTEDLKKFCKKLEQSKQSVDNFVPPTKKLSSLEPDLAYVEALTKPVSNLDSKLPNQGTQKQVKCFLCRRWGHYVRNCPQKQLSNSQSNYHSRYAEGEYSRNQVSGNDPASQ